MRVNEGESTYLCVQVQEQVLVFIGLRIDRQDLDFYKIGADRAEVLYLFTDVIDKQFAEAVHHLKSKPVRREAGKAR